MRFRPLHAAASRALVRRLGADRRGTAIIEFAICGTMFITLLIVTLTTALSMFAQQCIQTAADTMARQVLTGKAQLAGTSADDFRKAACDELPSFFSCAGVMIDLRQVDNLADIGTPLPPLTFDGSGKISNRWAYDRAAAGDIVILRVMYAWPVPSAMSGFDLQNAGRNRSLLVGIQAFKTETYS